MYASSQPRQTFAGGWIQFPAFQIHSPTPVRVKLSLKGSNHIAETHWTTQKTKKFKNLSFKMKLFSLNGRVCGNVALLFWQRKPSLFFLGSFFSIWGLEQFIGASQWRHTDTLDPRWLTVLGEKLMVCTSRPPPTRSRACSRFKRTTSCSSRPSRVSPFYTFTSSDLTLSLYFNS